MLSFFFFVQATRKKFPGLVREEGGREVALSAEKEEVTQTRRKSTMIGSRVAIAL